MDYEVKTERKNEMLCLTNFDVLKQALDTLKESVDTVVIDDIYYKKTKEVRTAVNKLNDQLLSIQKSYQKDYMHDFMEKSDALKKECKAISKTLDEKIYSYEMLKNLAKPRLKSIVFKTYDENTAQKVLEIIKSQLGLEGEIK